jgi:hypothetical protein
MSKSLEKGSLQTNLKALGPHSRGFCDEFASLAVSQIILFFVFLK